eukprot:TRINITY_DN8228_c0_g1_i1.p1 TRINITY_DN8228_c0_g1~~TRINITY_DN8228_c0_g1_i1.p1  ORF type:complete len:215 (+),score=24.90 TRINITY_DN8228_c0_g1_i1:150-794(+)
MPPKYWGSSDGIHLTTKSVDVASEVRNNIINGLVTKMAELKILSMSVAEAQSTEGPALRPQRLRKAASDVSDMQRAVAGLNDIILCFGSSWRNAREFVVIRTGLSEFQPVSPSPLSEPVKEVQQLCSRFWRYFFQLMSEPELEWLTRSSSSRSYSMHVLSPIAIPGWSVASPTGFVPNPKDAVAFIDVTIGCDAVTLSSGNGPTFASPISVKTP